MEEQVKLMLKILWRSTMAALCLVMSANIAAGNTLVRNGNPGWLWRDASGTPVIWQFNGTERIASVALLGVADPGWAIAATADFDGNASSDIFWINSNNSYSIWYLDGVVANTSCYVPSGVDAGLEYMATPDLLGTGARQLLWRGADNSLVLWQMTGCGHTTGTLDRPFPAGAAFLGSGDFYGDGREDLLWRAANGNLSLWRMNGVHVQSITDIPNTANLGSQLAAICDFNGDGRADLLWRYADDSAAVWLMNGAQVVPQTVVDRSGDVLYADGFDGTVIPRLPVFPSGWHVLGSGTTGATGSGENMLQMADEEGHSIVWRMQGTAIVQSRSIDADPGMPYPGIDGWATPISRPSVTDAAGQVNVAWPLLPGNPDYVLYLSQNPAPASTGYGLHIDGAGMTYSSTDKSYNSNLYFAVGATFHGITVPPSKTAYRANFARTELPFWGALAIADIDGDGCNDILGALSNCDGTFTLLPEADMGLGALRVPGRMYRDLRFADFDGDGIDDVIANTYSYIGDPYSQVLLFHGIGDHQFVEDTAFTALDVQGYGETIVVADFNNDGYLDIFLPHYSGNPSDGGGTVGVDARNYLMLNDGTGHFMDVSDTAGVAMRNWSLYLRPEGAQALDFFGTGRLDIYTGSHFFINQGNDADGVPIFTDEAASRGLPLQFDEGAKFIDWNNDGWMDLVMLDPNGGGPLLYAFDGTTFQPTTVFPPWTSSQNFGLNAADLDGDGRPDLIVAGGCVGANPGDPNCSAPGGPHGLPHLLLNRGDHFVDATFFDDGLIPTSRNWNDLQTVADFSNKGTLDVVSRFAFADNDTSPNPDGHLSVLRNQAADDGTILVTVLGAGSERNQFGRLVQMRSQVRPNFVMSQVVDGGSGYMSNQPYDLTFATPDAGAYDIRVQLASQLVETTASAGQHVIIRADGSVTRETVHVVRAAMAPVVGD